MSETQDPIKLEIQPEAGGPSTPLAYEGPVAGYDAPQPVVNPPMTFGQKAVGIRFNPGGDPSVEKIKELYAEIIDFLDIARRNTQDGGKIRHLSTAITDAETAQMRAVKGITWNS